MRALFVILLASGCSLHAHPLLEKAAEKWLAERNRWSFTQVVRETDQEGRTTERVEKFNPSRGPEQRWKLISVDGRAPVREELEKWEHRKNRRTPRPPKPLDHYVDLAKAEVTREDDRQIEFRLPLRRPVGWLASGQHVILQVSVDKQTEEVARVQAGLDAPMNVALGLAQVVHLDFDIEAQPDGDAGPERADPEGAAYAVVNRLGRRIEYAWRDFEYVDAR